MHYPIGMNITKRPHIQARNLHYFKRKNIIHFCLTGLIFCEGLTFLYHKAFVEYISYSFFRYYFTYFFLSNK